MPFFKYGDRTVIEPFFMKNMEPVSLLFFCMVTQLRLKCLNSLCRCMQKISGAF